MKKYKFSQYSIFIDIAETGEMLIYNSFTGGLSVLGEKEAKILKSVVEAGEFSSEDERVTEYPFLKTAIEDGYFTESSINEIEQYHDAYLKYKKELRKNGTFGITIAPTLNCNLACRYCFQTPSNGRHLSIENEKYLVDFLKKELKENKLNEDYKRIHISWYGGEPSLRMNQIERLSKKLQQLAKKNNLSFSSSMVTNGTLLNTDMIMKLKLLDIDRIQITIDGPKEIHNLRRPIKNGSNDSYQRILKNLREIPDGISVTIRINTDKHVWENIDLLFEDLEAYGVWPHKAKDINLELAFISQYENARFIDHSWYFTYEEFVDIIELFIDKKIQKYNKWAERNGKKLAKRKWNIPKLTFEDCRTAVSASSFALDPEGYVHKCWELVDKESSRINHISEDFNLEDKELKKWFAFDRVFSDSKCTNCEILPICNSNCVYHILFDKNNSKCSTWKYNLKEKLRKYYLLSINEPESIVKIIE